VFFEGGRQQQKQPGRASTKDHGLNDVRQSIVAQPPRMNGYMLQQEPLGMAACISMCDFRGTTLRDAAREIPMDRIVVEGLAVFRMATSPHDA